MRVLKDGVGKIMTDSGSVSLDKGSIHFLKRYAEALSCVVSIVLYALFDLFFQLFVFVDPMWSSLFGKVSWNMLCTMDSAKNKHICIFL